MVRFARFFFATTGDATSARDPRACEIENKRGCKSPNKLLLIITSQVVLLVTVGWARGPETQPRKEGLCFVLVLLRISSSVSVRALRVGLLHQYTTSCSTISGRLRLVGIRVWTASEVFKVCQEVFCCRLFRTAALALSRKEMAAWRRLNVYLERHIRHDYSERSNYLAFNETV